MAPVLLTLDSTAFDAINPSPTVQDSIISQWHHPTDIFSLLLLLGGDVVSRALAQLAGHGFTPVTFSFGWVSYSLSALASAVGENKLMPAAPDCKCKVINGKSGSIAENTGWILGRIVRDFDTWSHRAVKEKTTAVLTARWDELREKDPTAKLPKRAGLIVSIYTPSATTPSGTPKRDIMYWSGILLISVQLGLSVVPYALSGDWGILSVTACGTCLALLTGALPQWKKEKWACRRFSNDTYLLTRGNGAQHALVVLANGRGLNLEDLAGGQNNMDASTNSWTRTAILALTVAWGMLLITATGLRDNTWYLLAVGAIGILHSIFVSGRARRPESFGIPLDFVGVFGQTKVMKTLFEVEAAYPDLGRSMLDEFFPGRLREDEIKIWAEFAHKAEQVKEALKM